MANLEFEYWDTDFYLVDRDNEFEVSEMVSGYLWPCGFVRSWWFADDPHDQMYLPILSPPRSATKIEQ